MEASPTNIEVVVDLSVYSQTAIFKATYKFTGSWYVDLVAMSDDTVKVVFTPKAPTIKTDQVRGEFLNELLDQRLREQIGSETLAVRNLIMAHALSKLELVHTPSDHDSAQAG